MGKQRAPALLASFTTYINRVLDIPSQEFSAASDMPGEFNIQTLLGVTYTSNENRRSSRSLKRSNLQLQFSGASVLDDRTSNPESVHIYDRWNRQSVPPRPESFDVLAIITTFNESDVIEGLIHYLTSQGVRIHVIDNWSTDGTDDIVSGLVGHLPVTMERFPERDRPEFFELEKLLKRIEEVANDSAADWIIHHDADEIRQSPWSEVKLADALWMIDYWGFNAIDHTVVDFRPIEDSWQKGKNLLSYFEWCEFGSRGGHFAQIKTWKPQAKRLDMASSGGHQVNFELRKVFPYKFITRHYPIRSQSHGERKILKERLPRWSPDERKKGWHTHYDIFNETTSFIWDTQQLFRWDEIDARYFIERLSGVGLPGNPNPSEGPVR